MPRLFLLALTIFLLAEGLTMGSSEDPSKLPHDLAIRVQRDIEKYRKSDAQILVRDARGKPVEGASVLAKQISHDFLFGCNIFRLDNLPTEEQNEQYKALFKRLLNYATLPFYWASFESEKGRPNHERLEKMARWCKENGITTKGHPLVWTHPAGVPKWLDESDPVQVKHLLEMRVSETVSRYKGLVDIWDVVNESTHTRTFAGLSMYDYTALPFVWARKANQDATLIVNEFGVIGPNGGDQKYFDLLSQMKANKVPFDAIGIQTHMHRGPLPLRQILETLDRYAKLGKPIHFTETTFLSGGKETTPEGEKKQAEYVEQFYRTCFSHPSVKAITWWDFSDAGAWQGVAAGLVRKDMTPKPAYLVLDRLINKEWRTTAEGVTDSTGTFSFRGFHGIYRVTVSDKSGKSKTVEFHISEKGHNTITVRL